jgi:ribonuclease-3
LLASLGTTLSSELLELAFTHGSYSREFGGVPTNERLEHLGDSVLELIITGELYKKFPDVDESRLSKMRAGLVNNPALVPIAKELELGQYLRIGKGEEITGGREKNSILANAFEALVGAIYLDAGYDQTKKIIRNNVLRKYLNLAQLLEEEIDFKSALFIWCQRKKLSLEFKLLDEQFNDGKWQYEMEVQINRTAYGKGKGLSKKEAEQAASKETLALMGEI